ncbi:MAG TPA: FtsX-like permease family protein [Gemmatimonadales bacterium]|nr:FtsX-like permease family protein [Gemmatimonadales bacterium]
MRAPFALVMAWRESRGSRRRLALYLGAVSLGVAALVAINSFRADVTASVHAQARTLLGADLELRSRSPFPDSVEAVFDSLRASGVPIARVTSFASMALAVRSGRTRLVDVRAVAGGFPFYGTIATDPPALWTTFRSRHAVLVDPAVLVYLEATPGDTVQIGDARFVIAGVVTDAPGDVSLWSAIGPRVYLPAQYLAETHLLQFGSLAQYRAYFQLPDAQVQPFLNHYNKLLQRHLIGSETVSEQEEDLTRALGRLARYLGLVGLIALLLGGLGVGSAVSVFVRDKLDGAALLRCLGARQRTVLAVYLLQAAALGLIGAGVGVFLGVLVQATLPAVLGGFLPLDVSVTLQWSTMLTGLGIGVGTACLFALLPLLQLRDVSPLRVLRRDLDAGPVPRPARWWRLVVAVMMVAGLVALSRWQAPRPLVGYAFAAAVLVTTAALWLTAKGLIWATRRWFPRRASYVIRQGIANLFRPQNQTVAVMLAIGFGVFLITTLYVVQRSLVAQFALDAQPDRPNLVFFDVQVDERDSVARILNARGVRALDVAPIVPARIARVNGRPIDSLSSDSLHRRSPWVLRREYRNTYRDTLVGSERLTAGTWWTAPRSPGDLPRVSVEEDIASSLAVGLGDRITWNVQGVMVETRVASFRQVSWARFQPNFFVVFEPGVLERAPQTFVLLARTTDPTLRAELQRDVTLSYPGVSSLDLTLVHRTLDNLIAKVTLAIRFMALFSIGSGLVILIGALTASRLQRAREAVLLKTLGASTRQVRGIFLTEYSAWGSLAALTGVVLAGAAGWAIMTRLFELPFRLPVLPLLGVWVAVCGLVVAVGLAHSRAVVRGTPLAMWRALSE